MTVTSCRSRGVMALIALLTCAVVLPAQQLVVRSVSGDEVRTDAVGEMPQYRSIYDVYTEPDEDGVYRDLVDSVYFVGTRGAGAEYAFESVWQGGGLYLSPGLHLVPTGRTYSVDTAAVAMVSDGSGP